MTVGKLFVTARLGNAGRLASENAAESFCTVLYRSVEPWHSASKRAAIRFAPGLKLPSLDRIAHGDQRAPTNVCDDQVE
jgi:hypothetical protein